jgi:uncharacterized protein (TIGR02147 family)
VYELGTRLGLSPTEVAAFAEKTSTKKKRKAIVDPVLNSSASRSAHELSLDAFQLIADWYHYAIFEMVTMKDFVPKPRWIAKALGISVNEVHLALERLERLELIRIDETGNFQQGQPLITTTGNPFTAVAFRKLQTHVLQMALSALEEVPMEARDQTSMTMAINSKKLPEAKERIKQFRRQLCDFLQEDTDERDSVYQLGVSLYPLTKMHLQDLKTNERKEARK